MAEERQKLVYTEKKKQSILEWLQLSEKGLLSHPVELSISLLAICLSLYHLYVAYAGSLEAHAFRSTHLAFILVLVFLLKPLGRRTWTEPINAWFIVDLVLIGLTIAMQVYKLGTWRSTSSAGAT